MADNAHSLSNAEIADRLASLAQLLSAQRENPYKVKAYQRAAAKIRTLSESIDELVREEMDLTSYAGIGEAISGAIQEIVRTGTLEFQGRSAHSTHFWRASRTLISFLFTRTTSLPLS